MIDKSNKKLSKTKMKEELLNLKKILMNLKFQKSTGQLEKISEIKKTKRNIARLKTEIHKTLGDRHA